MKNYIIILVLIVIVAGFLISSNYGVETSETQEINIDAKWFDFNPNLIIVKEGQRVKININNLDVPHGITIPELGLLGMDVVEFTANKKGTFNFYCENFCGVDHDDMIGTIIIE